MKKNIDISEIIDRVYSLEKQAVNMLNLSGNIQVENAITSIYAASGKVVVTGIGKSAFVGRKFVATLNSTGSSAVFLHAADALHGDVGMISSDDVVVLISKSGGSKEILELLMYLNEKRIITVGITSNESSFLAQRASQSIILPNVQEADRQNIIPTCSIITHSVVCDCIAIALMELRSFSSQDFANLHPRGTLGRQLSLVSTIAHRHTKPSVTAATDLKTIIYTISSNKLGACCVVSASGEIIGIITDGDIRRMIERTTQFTKLNAADIMTPDPKTINGDAMAKEAMQVMKEYKINQLIVRNIENKYCGMIHIQDLLKE